MKRLWGIDELLEHWTLLPDDVALLANKAGATRLGFAALLKAFQHDGRFPAHKGDVPGAVVAHLAQQVAVPTSAWLAYDWRGRASEYHRAQDPRGAGLPTGHGAGRRGSHPLAGSGDRPARGPSGAAPGRLCWPFPRSADNSWHSRS